MDNNFLLVISVLALGLLFLGHSTKVRIYNVFSGMIFMFLGFQVADYTMLLIIMVGISIYELYYGFLGGIK